jgi:hypothetical protein
LEEIGIVEMTRGTLLGDSRVSIGCSSSLEPALAIKVWLELLSWLSLLFQTMLSGAGPVLTIDWRRNISNCSQSTAKAMV